MGKRQENAGLMGLYRIYPLVMTITVCELENDPVKIESFPNQNNDLNHRYVLVYQRVMVFNKYQYHLSQVRIL